MDYTNRTYEEIDRWLKNNLNEKRYIHSIGVMECAIELAKKFGLNENKALIAGLLHDCAKCFSNEHLLEIINTKIKNVNKSELLNYKTLHAPVSAYIAKNEFGVEDEEVLSAIRWHTLGKLQMSDFEKIIFLADKIEAKTRPSEYRAQILEILEKENGLNLALLKCFSETIKSLVKRELPICHLTIDVFNELLDCTKETNIIK